MDGAGPGWADGTICRVGIPCAAFLAPSPWLLLSRRLFGFVSMTTCDLAQRLGDGAEMYRTVTCACLVVRLASVRSGRPWGGLLGFLVLAARWNRFREARVGGDLPVRRRACGLPHGMLAFQLPVLSAPGSASAVVQCHIVRIEGCGGMVITSCSLFIKPCAVCGWLDNMACYAF